MTPVSMTVNGKIRQAHVEPRMLLVHFLREQLNLTGTHIGCDTSQCGACTVLVDGRSVKSCTLFAVQVDSCDVITIEGLARDGRLHALQDAFWQEHGLQCGFCTPGMILSAVELLEGNPSPSEREIREGIDGNFCRCTGYQHIVNAIQRAAADASEHRRASHASGAGHGAPALRQAQGVLSSSKDASERVEGAGGAKPPARK